MNMFGWASLGRWTTIGGERSTCQVIPMMIRIFCLSKPVMWLFLGLDFGSVMGSVMVLCQELSKYYILDRTVLIEYAMAAKNTEIKNSLFQPRRVSLDGAVHDPGVILWTGKVAVIVSKVKENSFLGGGEILLRAGQCPNPFAGFLLTQGGNQSKDDSKQRHLKRAGDRDKICRWSLLTLPALLLVQHSLAPLLPNRSTLVQCDAARCQSACQPDR